MSRPHPTQIFMSNPQALRVEYRVDDERLELWWSPLAGKSNDCADRNYSSRDAHLDIFEEIRLLGCGLDEFRSCDYDPYHCVLHFDKQALHLVLRTDLSAVILYAERPQAVELKAFRHDETLSATGESFVVRHPEPRLCFEFAACLAPGAGSIRHPHFHLPGNSRFARVEMAPGQLLLIGVGLAGEGVPASLAAAAQAPLSAHVAATEAALEPIQAMGRIQSARHPELEALRRIVVRGLHSMIDESGAFRASLKAIYYLIWVRDGGFSFPYQAGAGWPHRLPEFCRLLLDNPMVVNEPGLPPGRAFAQLVNRSYGRLEEDGFFYVIWSLFTQWTQSGKLDFVTEADWQLLDEALEWVEKVTWDEARGLYGEHFADETPTVGHRDCGYDYAIGKPIAIKGDGLHLDGKAVIRNYDVYFNILMHSAYAMLMAMRGETKFQDKAARVWPELARLLKTRHEGIPVNGEQLLEDGSLISVPHWGQAHSCCVWGLTMPGFTPLEDWDSVWEAVMDAVAAKPDMHFMNGVCSVMAAVDPWLYPEAKLIDLHRRVSEEAMRPGKYLPMGGAMPEKFAAPEGNIYHDIRPQGFAMGAWLAAFASLGLRRLPHGLALRPTSAYESLECYPWRGRTLHFSFGSTGRALGIEIDGSLVQGTLQVPEARLGKAGSHDVRLVEAAPRNLLLRSSVRLNDVEDVPEGIIYQVRAFGIARMDFSGPVSSSTLQCRDGTPIPCSWSASQGIHSCHFTHFGEATLQLGAANSLRCPA